MKVWLYKARDIAASGEPRADYEATRAFAVEDGVLARSAYERGGRGAFIANVQYVEAGDILLIYFRKTTPPAGVRFIGSFRVLDPGAARFSDDCDLAILADDIAQRVRAAYGTPAGEPITAWLLDPALEVAAPSLEEPAVAEFLARRATLVEYVGPLGRKSAREPSLDPRTAWSGRVTLATFAAVTLLSDVTLSFSPAINVIIGENGSGKTHVLKSMYALLRAAEEAGRAVTPARGDKLERVLTGPARSLFAAEGAITRIRVDCERARFVREEEPSGQTTWSSPPAVKPRAIFVPSREVLAMFPGFVKLYEDRDISFDETYYDLCRDLNQVELRETPPSLTDELVELEGTLGGSVRLDANRFVVDTVHGPIAASMVAEGHRKLACLAYLIKAGALTPETTLFWDEPEANLNPKLVRVVAQLIRKLAAAGVQIFLATHDYLLTRELSMEAEARVGDLDTRFFALHRHEASAPVQVEHAHSWGALQENPIFEAYAAHHDREQELFSGSKEEPT
jgi:energy-coupling factor transporter ATP-binding protein EcfA2